MRERQSFETNDAEKTGKKIKMDLYYTLYVKNNSKWIEQISTRAKTIKLLGENIWKKLHIAFNNDSLDMTPNTVNKRKRDKLDYIKIKNFCLLKDNQQSESQCRELDKLFSNFVSGKRLISVVYKEVYNSTITQLKNGQITWIDISAKTIHI